ncbi:type II secretion system ATPase GspE [Geoalkalibacter subterraneus]|uniref:protein-secreting ATPase n=1 Tax=Geoalkalibacter subterraneus TaxID=483547 RepID=A0A0B5FS12_9BACT|nr:type II secretion system ATPase GspE [Geoalkalibacter subterraneus]AJF06376.1 general secretion pathway protein GspE [Geoalkalibacter subterraneus]
MTSWQHIGQILREDAGLSEEALEQALAAQENDERRLGEIMLERKVISSEQLARALARQHDLPFVESISTGSIDHDLLDQWPIGFAKEFKVFPIRSDGDIVLVMADPGDNRPLNDLSALTGEPVEASVATPTEILRAINQAYETRAGETEEIIADIGGSGADSFAGNLEPADLIDTSDEAPIIRFVNSLVTQAYRERASDIHIEPFEGEMIVRYRIDGILYEVLKPPIKAHAGIISRVKIMSNLNIAEKRLPQDGRFRVRIAGKDVDVRVSTLPTAFGERVVMRLLDKSSNVLTLEDIGMEKALLQRLNPMIHKSHGIFLVTGPTGSGKTTTLYAALTRLNSREKNIITVEDPIEYQLNGVGQIQVNPKINLTFANGLRSILRQDPDIIMIGEIRDGETAEIAVQSALTGHMVFSTLHTNDSAGALTRLVEMQIEPFLIASSVVGVMAQRLVRTICPHCKESYQPSTEALEEMGLSAAFPNGATFYRGRGCEKCMDIGYRGRSGIYELLTVDEQVRDLVLKKSDSATIKNAACRAGMVALREAGLAKALAGQTTLEEVMRVTQEEG